MVEASSEGEPYLLPLPVGMRTSQGRCAPLAHATARTLRLLAGAVETYGAPVDLWMVQNQPCEDARCRVLCIEVHFKKCGNTCTCIRTVREPRAASGTPGLERGQGGKRPPEAKRLRRRRGCAARLAYGNWTDECRQLATRRAPGREFQGAIRQAGPAAAFEAQGSRCATF